MSGSNPTIPQWFEEEWDDQVIHAYQDGGGRITPYVRHKTVNSAEKMNFRTIGQIKWAKLIGEGKRPRTGAKRQKIQLIPKPSGAMLEVAEFDVSRFSPEDRDAQYAEAVKAMNRYRDDEVMAAAAAATINTDFGGAGEFMSPTFVSYIWETLNAQGIYAGEVELYAAASPRAFSQLERFDQFMSADYRGAPIPGVSSAGMKTWRDLNWIRWDKMPIAGDLHSVIVWAQPAIAHGSLKENRTIWSWQNEEDVWLCNMKMETDAVIIIENGVHHFQIDGSIAPESIDPDTMTVV